MNNLEILNLVKDLSLEQTTELVEKINMVKRALSDSTESNPNIEASPLLEEFSEEIDNDINDAINYERIIQLAKFFNERDTLRLLFPNFVPFPLTTTCQSVSG
jgi:hypothetical protein